MDKKKEISSNLNQLRKNKTALYQAEQELLSTSHFKEIDLCNVDFQVKEPDEILEFLRSRKRLNISLAKRDFEAALIELTALTQYIEKDGFRNTEFYQNNDYLIFLYSLSNIYSKMNNYEAVKQTIFKLQKFIPNSEIEKFTKHNKLIIITCIYALFTANIDFALNYFKQAKAKAFIHNLNNRNPSLMIIVHRILFVYFASGRWDDCSEF